MKYFFFVLTLLFLSISHAQVLRQRTLKLMGSRFDITIVHENETKAEAYIDTAVAEISRIENVISEWMPNTEVSEVNRNAGIKPVKVSAELLNLTERALYFSKISDGAFDISFAAADKIWKFDGSMTELPSAETVAESVKKIGYKNIVIDKKNSTIFLKLIGMKIGFGSIGKGYAADKTKEFLMKKGVPAGIINASGDMNTWGTQPDGEQWTVGITNPMDKNQVFAVVPLKQTAVVTSGNYEKYAMINGKRYAHIINPKTGYPATGLSSVTVFGPNAEMCNGFSTAIMVLGKDVGLHLIEQFPNLQCIVVTDEGDISSSKNIELKLYKP
ncbi:FAD:protein FMN transferase [Flavobacterium sp. MAH-1]|uniref:FAD:protein FMN transferase n=1 Tax=Flavobacterium agri TaxID=2743471 RepID=A0A7Y8Y4V8_9FLAO|nr:FAD:protein FMN transferase [Flavobacterium agri]NUY82477.1 FAD:protein FMN transferase [Flavobacterium agri]NYA72501.1 FAD:protein FMN transferase [Flavobacterium agri]